MTKDQIVKWIKAVTVVVSRRGDSRRVEVGEGVTEVPGKVWSGSERDGVEVRTGDRKGRRSV